MAPIGSTPAWVALLDFQAPDTRAAPRQRVSVIVHSHTRLSSKPVTDVGAPAIDPREAITNAARPFVRTALRALQDQHVYPTPRWRPHIAVGRDYGGGDVIGPEFNALEEAITRAHSRFGVDVPLGERDFAKSYIYSFLEACVARLADPFPAGLDAALDRPLSDLIAAVEADQWEVACCRVVTHLRTQLGQPLNFDGVEVVPIIAAAENHRRTLDRTISSVIAGAATAYSRENLDVWDNSPQCVLVARAVDAKPFDAVNELSNHIERLLTLIRLVHAGTCQSVYEVQGETSTVRRFRPTLQLFRGTAGLMSSTSMVRRAVTLDAGDDGRFSGLRSLMQRAQRERPDMAVTSFELAVQRFRISYHAYSPYDQIVDLATALEGAIAGSAKTDVVLRLKTRCAALLATENDPGGRIFGDLTLLYELRSTLVHAGEMKRTVFAKKVRGVSTVPKDAPNGVALAFAVDRLRDLVRRSLLARICLAGNEHPVWELGADSGVDTQLADDRTRHEWRTAWRQQLEACGAQAAAEAAPPAIDALFPDD